MVNLLLALFLLAIAGGIIAYLVHEKKKGVTCIGCPYAQQCAKRKSGCSCGTVHPTSVSTTCREQS